jgi:outer membrane receptor protein involved in Fe transport
MNRSPKKRPVDIVVWLPRAIWCRRGATRLSIRLTSRPAVRNTSTGLCLRFQTNEFSPAHTACFSAPRERPSYQFANLTDFVNDQVFQESGVTFSPLTGQFSPNLFGDQNTRIGAFFQDDWKLAPNFLLTVGIRWDDFGVSQATHNSPITYPSLARTENRF